VRGNDLKPKTLNELLRVYDELDVITRRLNNLVDEAVLAGDYEDASLLQARADILYEQMEYLDIVISEYEG
jgi:ferritin